MTNAHDITREFERLLAEYTGAKHVIAVDSNCSGLFLCLRWRANKRPETLGEKIQIPRHTYIGVPYVIRAAGYTPIGDNSPFAGETAHLDGEYQLGYTDIWDSALSLYAGMARDRYSLQVLSFTGPYKHLKLGKGGAILCNDDEAAAWLRRAAFSGRNYVSYHEDVFDMAEGYNMYMAPQIAALGALLMPGLPKQNKDLYLPYPDWTQHPAFKADNP